MTVGRYREIVEHYWEQRELQEQKRAQQRVPAGSPGGGQWTSGGVRDLKQGDTFKIKNNTGWAAPELKVLAIKENVGAGTHRVKSQHSHGNVNEVNLLSNLAVEIFKPSAKNPAPEIDPEGDYPAGFTGNRVEPKKRAPSLSVAKANKVGWPQE